MKYPNLIEHFEMILSSLQGELYGEAMATTATFKMRLAELEAQLSEFQNGLPIEKAKTDKQYFHINDRGYPALVENSDEDGFWYAGDCVNGFYIIESGTVYPLPSTDTATKEGE